MRAKLLAGNWKMHKTPSEARPWLAAFLDELGRPRAGAEVAILPSFPVLPVAAEVLAGSGVAWGAQDVSAHDWGAYTGEVSAHQVADTGARYAIVGHSERRRYWRESSAVVAQKTKRALEAGLVPILCVGEDLEVREAGSAEAFVRAQLLDSLDGVEPGAPERLVVAYEPVWAIGTGRTARPEDAENMAAALRAALAERYGSPFAERVRILYGGSIKPENFPAILAGPNVDGGLVGGASLEVASFALLYRQLCEIVED